MHGSATAAKRNEFIVPSFMDVKRRGVADFELVPIHSHVMTCWLFNEVFYTHRSNFVTSLGFVTGGL